MARYAILNKPYQVLTQFTDQQDRKTLADFVDIPGIYSAGRLDMDSEGLLILTDDGPLIHSMMDPAHKTPKTYLAQVEGIPTEDSLAQLRAGLTLKDGKTRPCEAMIIEPPEWLWDREPPIRERKNIPTSWLQLILTEGKNRQVRRMTAHIGFPTLRLVRSAIGDLSVSELNVGECKEVSLSHLMDNGIKLRSKKGSSSAASFNKNLKRSGSRQPRNRRRQNQNQTIGKTRPDSR